MAPVGTSFAVGPARVVPAFPRYVREAYRSGLLSIHHRQEAFATLWKEMLQHAHEKLCIPPNYKIVSCASAHECWEIVAQSFTGRGSFHLCNGSFGQKWEELASALHKSCGKGMFGVEKHCSEAHVDWKKAPDLVACTHNETSNGTKLTNAVLEQLGASCQAKSDVLLAVDATSSLGAMEIAWASVDICFASVQKGLGLPAGLALLVASPRAVERAYALKEKGHYNSYLHLLSASEASQAAYTPNVLNIYALMRTLKDRAPLGQLARLIKRRADAWYRFFLEANYDLLVDNVELRSDTVIALRGEPTKMARLLEDLRRDGLAISAGHGFWKKNTLRLGNFPAISAQEIATLRHYLSPR